MRRITWPHVIMLALTLSCCASQPSRSALDEAQEKLEAGNLDEARSLAQTAAREDAYRGRNVLADVERATARAAETSGDLSSALDAWAAAIEAEPTPADRAPDASHAAEIARQLGDVDQQSRFLELAVTSTPSSIDVRRAAAFGLDEAGLGVQAIPHYLWLWEADRSQANLGSRLAALYLEAERFKDAAAIFKVLLEAKPDNVQAALGRTEALLALGRMDEAERQLRAILALFPDNAALKFRLADLLDRRGKSDEAQRVRQTAQGDLPGIERRDMRKLR